KGELCYNTLHHPIDSLFGDVILPKPRLARSLEFPLLAFCWIVAAGNLRAQQNEALPVKPLPAHVVRGGGEFGIDGPSGVALKGYKEPRLKRARQRLL